MKKTELKTRRTARATSPDAASPSGGPDELRNLEGIKKLIELVAEKQFTSFELELGDFRISLQRRETGSGMEVASQLPSPIVAPGVASAAEPTEAITAAVPAGTETALEPAEEVLHWVRSPIVGTFYRAPSPEARPFVEVGDVVAVGATLCIIEAMKLMNEITTEVSGTIVKILAENGQPVEYGQPLFGIKV
jgi:acetyl-CoA carboxylase biotin carboxyl carrier protein